MKDTLLELAGRCEAATGPDRELDAAIMAKVGGVTPGGLPYFGPVIGVAAFTRNLDDARLLVPKGWNWNAGIHRTGCGHSHMDNGELHFIGAGMRRNPAHQHAEVRAATPALAFCAAALRARAALASTSNAARAMDGEETP